MGSGEALNEHILGDPWPGLEQRLSMLEESVAIMRALWEGNSVSHDGQHYIVDRVRLYSLPDEPPPVLVSAFGPQAAEVAGRIGDGYINVAPDPDLLATYRDAGGSGPAQAGTKICWGADEAACIDTVYRLWPNEALGGELAQVLPMPAHYEAACAGHQGDDRRGRAVRTRSRPTPLRSRSSSTPATTRSTSTRSATTKKAS